MEKYYPCKQHKNWRSKNNRRRNSRSSDSQYFDSSGTEGVTPATLEFEADVTGGTEPYTVIWYLDDNGIAESNEQSLVAVFNEDSTYEDELIGIGSRGQIASDIR